MQGNVILKSGVRRGAAPNMVDYEAERETFSWEAARDALDGLPGGRGLNIAHEAVVRHAMGPRRDHVAIRCIDRHGARVDVTYRELNERSNRFANVLSSLGVQAGERVFALMPRAADLYVVAMGTLKHRSVLCPLFSAFGPEPIRQRLGLGNGCVLVTTPTLYRHKVMAIRDSFRTTPRSARRRIPGLGARLAGGGARPLTGCSPRRQATTKSTPPTPRTWRCCTSPAARRVRRRAPSTSMMRSCRTTPPGESRSICTLTTCSGARRIPVGSPEPPTASSRLSCTA